MDHHRIICRYHDRQFCVRRNPEVRHCSHLYYGHCQEHCVYVSKVQSPDPTPCQDVPLLNANLKGAFGRKSSFRIYFQQVFGMFLELLPGVVFGLMECTRMDPQDRVEDDSVFGFTPFEVCSSPWQHITRPRWWWFSWDVKFRQGMVGTKCI